MIQPSTTAVPPGTCLSHGAYFGSACPYCSTGTSISWLPALLLLLALGCTDKRAPRPTGIDSTLALPADTVVSGTKPDSTALDSLIDSQPQPPVSVDTILTPSLPVVDTSAVIVMRPETTVVTIDTVQPPPIPVVVVTVPAKLGIPFGPTGLWVSSTTLGTGADLFTASTNSDSPDGVAARITKARAVGQKLFLGMTGGKHSRYLTDAGKPATYVCPTNGSPTCKFDLAKWKARQSEFDTPANRKAIADGVADGTVLGANFLDEPQHGSWGGVITKKMLDSMAVYTKTIFPTLPVGVSYKFSWRPDERVKRVDFAVTQYVDSWGSVTAWRDKELAGARKDGVAVVFSFNILNGGAGFGETSCPEPATGGPGYSAGRCKMSAAQVRESAMALIPFGCAGVMWTYDAAFIAKNRAVFKDLKQTFSQLPSRSCRRS